MVSFLALSSSSQTAFPLESPTAGVGVPPRRRGRSASVACAPRSAPARGLAALLCAPPLPGHPSRGRALLLHRPAPCRRERQAPPPALARRRLWCRGLPWRGFAQRRAHAPASAPPPCARPAPRPPLPRSGRAVPPRACLAARRPRPRRAEQAKIGEAGVELGAGLPLTCGTRLSGPPLNVFFLFI